MEIVVFMAYVRIQGNDVTITSIHICIIYIYTYIYLSLSLSLSLSQKCGFPIWDFEFSLRTLRATNLHVKFGKFGFQGRLA